MYSMIPQPVGSSDTCCSSTSCVPCDPCPPGCVPDTELPEVIIRDTIADMAATVPTSGLVQINVLAGYTAGDGLGGIYNYISSSVATSDGYYVVDTPTGVGRYIRFLS